MLIEALPQQHYQQLQGKNWGYLSKTEEELPEWVKNIPDNMHLRFLATGPAFYDTERQKEIITSESLINEEHAFLVAPTTLTEAAIDWYLLISDRELTNILLTDGPFDQHEAWIQNLHENCSETILYLVPKHPDQGEQ